MDSRRRQTLKRSNHWPFVHHALEIMRVIVCWELDRQPSFAYLTLSKSCRFLLEDMRERRLERDNWNRRDENEKGEGERGANEDTRMRSRDLPRDA